MNSEKKELMRIVGVACAFLIIAVLAVISASGLFSFAKHKIIMTFSPPDAVQVEVFEKTAIMVRDTSDKIESVSVTSEEDVDTLRSLLTSGNQLSEEPACDFGDYRFVMRAEHYPSGVYSLCKTCPIIEYQVYAEDGGYDYFWYELTEDANHQLVDMLNKYGIDAPYASEGAHGTKADAEKAERNAQKK